MVQWWQQVSLGQYFSALGLVLFWDSLLFVVILIIMFSSFLTVMVHHS